MLTRNNDSLDVEPTPEFDARCMDAVQRWNAGEMPYLQSLQVLNGLLREATKNNHAANRGRAEHLLGYLHHYHGNLNTSIHHYNNAHRYFARISNYRRMAIMDLNQGENYRGKGEFTYALQLYQSAFEIAESLEDMPIQAMARANMGLTWLSMKDYNAARSALQEAYAFSEQWTTELDRLSALRCEIHHGLARIYLFDGDLEAAWEQARTCLDNAAQPLQIGFANQIMGDVLTALGECPDPNMSEQPDDYYRRGIAALREIDAQGELARLVFSQAKSYARRGKRRASARKFRVALEIFTKLGMIDDAQKTAKAQLEVT